MRAIPRRCLAACFAACLTACAATLPAPETFGASEWAAVLALQPGTRVDVAYVGGESRPLRYSFEGVVETVTATHLVIRTEEGQQRLLAERVLRVSRFVRVAPGGGRAWQRVVWGAIAGAGLLAVLPGETEGRRSLMPAFALGGALVGFSTGYGSTGHARQVVYQRE